MKGFLKAFAILLSLLGVGIVSALVVVAMLLRQEEVRVPNLTGQDIVTAVDILSQSGLQVKIERREPHPTLPRNAVISQSPQAGIGIKKGRPVRVVVSLGPSELQAPDFTGQHFRKAEAAIRQAGLLPAGISRAASDDLPRDIVIAQDPPAGSPIEKGGGISLLVSAGRKRQVFVMPGLLGKRPDQAVRILERMGLQYKTTYRADERPGVERRVLSQKPERGQPVSQDGTVELVVGK